MERSIELIWKEGFLKEDRLSAGKVVHIYNRKSTHLVDRMHRMFKGNAIFIVVLVVLHVSLMLWMFHLPFHAVTMGLIFFPLIIYGRQQLKLSEHLDKSEDCYQFLTTFRAWIWSSIRGYTKIFRWFYPVYILTLGSALWISPSLTRFRGKLIDKLPVVFEIVGGIPIYLTIGLVVMAVISSIYAPKLYELDLRSIYGGVLDKLDDMVHEMEELRSSEGTSD